jgi:DNA-binding MarR family transcriptional regulator
VDDLDAATEATMAASRAFVGVVVTSMAPVADRVTLAQFRILVLLAEQKTARMGDLARQVGVHHSTLSRTADRLVEAGFARRVENPASRREIFMELTPPGRRLVKTVMDRRARMIRDILAPLTLEQRTAVAEGLALFAAAVEEPGDESSVLLAGA